jgi:hypothetical protein
MPRQIQLSVEAARSDGLLGASGTLLEVALVLTLSVLVFAWIRSQTRRPTSMF